MNRPLIITIGIVIILLVVALWAYLLIFGAPTETRGVFTNLGLVPEAEREVRIVEPVLEQEGAQLSLSSQALQQLTTRAVAGASFISEDGKPAILYAESGTGHIYKIDLESKRETQISVSTFAQTAKALFSPLGTAVALTEFNDYSSKTSVGIINSSDSTLQVSSLPGEAENIAFKDETTVYYTKNSDNGTVGYSYNSKTDSTSTLFTLDIPSIRMLWGHSVEGFYAYTKPSQYLEGYIYKITNGKLSPLPIQGFGLTAFAYKDQVVVTNISDDGYTSVMFENGIQKKQPLLMLEEKCVTSPLSSSEIWCASDVARQEAEYLEDWYKGIVTSTDYLWLTDLEYESAQLIIDFKSASGRSIDVTNMSIDAQGKNLLFINKIDQTLWMYRI